LIAAALLAGGARRARAASNDEDVDLLVKSVLEGEYLQTQFGDALEKLELARQACEGKTCSPKTRARLYIALGTVFAGGLKKLPEATEAFVTALREDPTIGLFSDYITPEVQRAFNDARAVAKGSSGTSETKDDTERGPKKKYPGGGGRPPRGWKSSEAYFYFREATASEKEREWLDCADYAQASLTAENRATTRFLAASCEERAGLWIEALADYQVVADTAGKSGLFDTATEAGQRAQALRDKIPKIILRKPPNAQDLVVKMNDAEVPVKKLGGEIWVNPGQRVIYAKGKVDGSELEFEQTVDLAEFETATVEIKLAPKGARADSEVMRCMAKASTREELAKCISGPGKGGAGLNFRLGVELSAYHDSDNVDVGSPGVTFGVESPTSGWGANAGFLVDVVTTASTDIIASASPRWTEFRYVPTLGGHKKFGDVDVSAHTELSVEPDYLATGGGVGAALDLVNKTVTPSLSYDFGYNISGRSGTPFSVYGNVITDHGITVGLGLVLDKSTFLALGINAIYEFGDSSKPYRYIPMFDPAIANRVPAGYSIDAVNRDRLPVRVLEQLPTSRQRYAAAARIAHRFTSSTIRAEERIYVDNWGLKASTTDSSYLVDVTPEIRVWPHLRFHAQTAVDFWRLAYDAARTDNGQLVVRALRTGDRELGPLLSATLGGGARFGFGPRGQWGISVTGDFVYSRYLDHLFILQKFGYFGATAFEMEFE
jgi:hypothetical protein